MNKFYLLLLYNFIGYNTAFYTQGVQEWNNQTIVSLSKQLCLTHVTLEKKSILKNEIENYKNQELHKCRIHLINNLLFKSYFEKNVFNGKIYYILEFALEGEMHVSYMYVEIFSSQGIQYCFLNSSDNNLHFSKILPNNSCILESLFKDEFSAEISSAKNANENLTSPLRSDSFIISKFDGKNFTSNYTFVSNNAQKNLIFMKCKLIMDNINF